MGLWCRCAVPEGVIINLTNPRRDDSLQQTGQLLFKVLAKGREYKIYTDGHVEGFGDSPFVVNYWPALHAIDQARLRLQLQSEESSSLAEGKPPLRKTVGVDEQCA